MAFQPQAILTLSLAVIYMENKKINRKKKEEARDSINKGQGPKILFGIRHANFNQHFSSLEL